MIEQQLLAMLDSLEAACDPKNGGGSPRKRFALEAARLGHRLYTTNTPVAWCGVATPFELLHAMDVTSCFIEFVGAVLASSGMVDPLLNLAEQEGYSTDICSYHRAVAGAALQSILPQPDFLIATTCPCSSGFATVETLSKHYEKELFVLHVPPRNDEESVAYLADQFRAMAGFISRCTGRPLDADKLGQTIEKSNKARQILLQVYELAGAVPTPAKRRDMVNFSYIMMLTMGLDSAIELAEFYRDAFSDRIQKGEAGIPDEQVRLMWFQNRIQFPNPLEEMLEKEFNAAVVVDETNDITWDPIDPKDPYVGMARRALASPLTTSLDMRIAHLIQLARTHKIDGMINPCHWGCRQGTGARGLVAAGLKEAGIPVLNLEVDSCDPRNFSEGQARTRIGAFVEMIMARKAD